MAVNQLLSLKTQPSNSSPLLSLIEITDLSISKYLAAFLSESNSKTSFVSVLTAKIFLAAET